ncbi:MAG: hypothetical protein HUU10_10830 [Bacteroidetes bacterium]|nr:hypothetical protein [Bacteroidota bacterium]
MTRAVLNLLLAFLLTGLTGCELFTQHPDLGVTNQSGPSWNGVWYEGKVTIHNYSTTYTAYNVGISSKLKSGNTIVATGGGSGGTLEPGESIVISVVLTSAYDEKVNGTFDSKLYWTDEYDRSWSKSY